MSMNRFELWKDWYKHCLNHPVYKFLVLIGLAHSPSFEIHRSVKDKLDQHPTYTYSVRDEKPEKKSTINWGWHSVYILMIVLNGIMFIVNEVDRFSWQYWVYIAMLITCFVAGDNYRKKE